MNIKKYILCACLFYYCFSYSQKVSGFAGFGIYLDRSLDNSGFYSINGGLELKLIDNLKPEVEFNYFFGAAQDRTKEDENGFETERLVRTMSAANISLSPKIIIGDKENNIRFQILPKYNFTKVFAKGTLFTYDNAKAEHINTDSDKTSEIRHSIGVGVGFIFDFSDKKTQSLAFNLYYNNIDIASALNNLKFGNANYNTQQSLGLGIIYYFGLYKTSKNRKINL